MISEHAILSYFAQAQKRGWALMRRGSLATGWHAVYQGRLTDYALEIRARQIGPAAVEGRVCPVCRATFEPKRSDQEYCSHRCRNREAMGLA